MELDTLTINYCFYRVGVVQTFARFVRKNMQISDTFFARFSYLCSIKHKL